MTEQSETRCVKCGGGGRVPGRYRGSGWAWVPCAGCPDCEPEPSPQEPDPLHPTGRCTCAGEGRCAWCRRVPPPEPPTPEGVDDETLRITAEVYAKLPEAIRSTIIFGGLCALRDAARAEERRGWRVANGLRQHLVGLRIACNARDERETSKAITEILKEARALKDTPSKGGT